MRFVVVVWLAACWRGPATTTTIERPAQPSFVERVHGLSDLQRSTAQLEPKLALVLKRILGLASESERAALRDILRELADDVDQLAVRARVARARGADRVALADVDRRLADARVTLTKLRRGLRYATTLEDLQALGPVDASGPIDWTDDNRVDVVMTPAPLPRVRWRGVDVGP